MDKEKYARYVEIDCWRVRRERYLKVQRFGCEVCGVSPEDFYGVIDPETGEQDRSLTIQIHVHHLSYEHLGEEPDSELIALCRVCHDVVHGICKSQFRVKITKTCAELRRIEPLKEAKMRIILAKIAEYYPETEPVVQAQSA